MVSFMKQQIVIIEFKSILLYTYTLFIYYCYSA